MKETVKDITKELFSLGKQVTGHSLAWGKNNIKKITKWTIIGLVSFTVIGGGAAAAYTYIDYKLDNQAREAQTNILLKQAQSNNLTLKTPDEIKGIVSQAIGKDQGSLWFQELELSNGINGRIDRDWEDRFDFDDDDRFERGYDVQASFGQVTPIQNQYVYRVEVREKLMEYHLLIDAVSGQVLSSRVDNF